MKQKLQKRILIFAHDSSLYGASLSLLTILEDIVTDKAFDILLVLPYGGIIEERLIARNIKYRPKGQSMAFSTIH